MPELTDEQRRALKTREVSVVLSAGAGCGKTFVLTERFLSHIQGDLLREDRHSGLSELIAITFTERAAREMRDRIRRACTDRLASASDSQQAAAWWRLLQELDSARVCTIHSFCADLLRQHAVEAGLDPSFDVLDDAESRALLAAAVETVFRRRLARRDEALLELAASFDLRTLRELVGCFVGARGKPGFDKWLPQSLSPAESASSDQRTAHLVAKLCRKWETCIQDSIIPEQLRRIGEASELRTVLQLCDEHGAPSHPTMCERIESMRDCQKKLATGGGTREDLTKLSEVAQVQGGGGKKAWSSPAIYEAVKANLSGLREKIKTLQKLFDDVQGSSKDLAAEHARRTIDVMGLVRDVLQELEHRKRELAALDFDDLILKATRLVQQDERLRESLRRRVRLLMVDEFQDTDSAQLELVKALTGDGASGRLFVVGDLKQSIYRFRGAEPTVFSHLRREMPEGGRLSLTRNFRSQPGVLDFVNALFADALSEAGEPMEPLRAARNPANPQPVVEFVWAGRDASSAQSPKDENARDSGESSYLTPEVTANEGSVRPATSGEENQGKKQGTYRETAEEIRAREADWIARRLRKMFDEGEKLVYDPSMQTLRAVRPGDVAILFRALTSISLYEHALQRYGVDYYLVGGRAFYAQQEVYDVLNLLRAIDRPADEVSLAGALRSPFFALKDETLLWLAQQQTGKGLVAALDAVADHLIEADALRELDARERVQVTFAAETLRALREMKDLLGVSELLRVATERTGYDAALLAEFLGERKLANLEKLLDEARQFDQSGRLRLADFIAELDEAVTQQPHEAPAATTAENADLVRLMTIHQAKGLEFPVVVVADIDRENNASRQAAAYEPSTGPVLGATLPLADGSSGKLRNTKSPGYRAWAILQREEDRRELLRLFYVATTRAADYLVLSCGVGPEESSRGAWRELLAERFDLASGACKALLPEGFNDPTVRVVVDPPRSEVVAGEARRPALQRSVEQLVGGAAEFFERRGELRRGTSGTAPQEIAVAKAGSSRAAAAGTMLEGAPESSSSASLVELRGVPKLICPLEPDLQARRQFSVSTVSGELHLSDGPAENTGPVNEGVRGGADRSQRLGTLVHELLAARPWLNQGDLTEMARTRATLAGGDEGLIREAVELVRGFTATARCEKIRQAEKCYVELEYMLRWPTDRREPEGRYFRGYVDLLYRDQEGWHLLDYKTNRVVNSDVETAALQYELQMFVYALAVEQATGTWPAEIVLHFLRSSHEHRFAFDATARSRLTREVDAGIERLLCDSRETTVTV